MRDWEKIRQRYIGSDISLRQLAAEEDIPYQTVYRRSVKGEWNKSREGQRADGDDALERVRKKLIGKMEAAIDEGCIDGREIKALAGALKELKEMQKEDDGQGAADRQLEVFFVGDTEELSV